MATTSESLAKRVTRLEAIEHVRTLVCRYAEGADRRNDPKIMRSLFVPRASWEAKGFGRCEGADEIARHLARIAAEQITWSLHYMVAPRVEIDDDGASGRCRWYLWELAHMRSPASADAAHWIAGRYDSRVVRTSRGWRFESVQLELSLVSRYAEGWRLIAEDTNATEQRS